MSRKGSLWVPVGGAAITAVFVAGLGATVTDLGPWYQSLRQPSWKPPDALFGPAWTVIYTLLAVSFVLAWRNAKGRRAREWILVVFLLNGFLNVLWSLLFFRLQRPDWALVEVVLLALSVVLAAIVSGRQSRTAAVLLIPYLAWVVFAGILNGAVVQLNQPFGGG